jgi:two-component system, chemotaxis family, chemotaxis protein CheY
MRKPIKTVVIADDSDTVCGLLRTLLWSIGMQVVGEARDGKQALAVIAKCKPEIICLDIDMPELDGLSALNQIRIADTSVIVLMISAAATPENVRQAAEARADGFILKPFTAEKIETEIERAFARRLRSS